MCPSLLLLMVTLLSYHLKSFVTKVIIFGNTEDSHISSTFYENLEFPFIWSVIIFHCSHHPSHTQMPMSLHPVEEIIWDLLPQLDMHSCLHLIIRHVTMFLEVFLQLGEKEEVTRCSGKRKKTQDRDCTIGAVKCHQTCDSPMQLLFVDTWACIVMLKNCMFTMTNT